MICYCKRDGLGIITVIGQVDELEQVPEGHEIITESEREEWLTAQRREEQARREEAEAMPTPVEQMRADIDYLAALQGVSL